MGFRWSSARTRFSSTLTLALVGVCGSACFGDPRVEAPEDLEGLAKFFWTQQADATDEEMDDAVGKAHAVVSDLLADEDSQYGVLPHLSDEDLAPIGQDGVNDPSEAPGLFVVTRFDCDLDVLAEVLSFPDQLSLRPGVYDSYDRVFASERDAWLDGESAMIEWDVTYEATPTATQYEAKTHSAVRLAPKLDADVGPTLVQRTFLKEPALFAGDAENHVFDQDYQSETYWDAGNGEIFHLYGLWRFMQLGAVSVHDDIFIEFQLDGMVKWDEQTEAACATWPDLPAE